MVKQSIFLQHLKRQYGLGHLIQWSTDLQSFFPKNLEYPTVIRILYSEADEIQVSVNQNLKVEKTLLVSTRIQIQSSTY